MTDTLNHPAPEKEMPPIGLAIASLVLGIVSIVLSCSWLAGYWPSSVSSWAEST
jgi:hypothetical protein